MGNRNGPPHHTTPIEKDNVEADASTAILRALFDYWQTRCRASSSPPPKFTSERRQKLAARLREGYDPDDIRRAIDGAAVGAFVDDKGKRFDDLELICRNGSKLESFMARAVDGDDDEAERKRQENERWAKRAELTRRLQGRDAA